MTIDSFQGEHRYLSNFWPATVVLDGVSYPSVEHAYQAAKTTNIAVRRRICNLRKPGAAKKAGRTIMIREDWEQIKHKVMLDLVTQKFRDTQLRAKLVATGDAELIEGNTRGDCYWGKCRGTGKNHLGLILMQVREANKPLKGKLMSKKGSPSAPLKPKAGTVLVIDGNWYIYRVWFTLRTKRPIEEVLPYNFLNLVCKDACAVKASAILIAFDGPSVFRYDVFPGYKASRREKKAGHGEEEGGQDIYAYLPAVRKYLDACGVTWVQPKKHEADDVLGSAAVQYSPRYKVILGARDKDIYQVLSPNVSMYDSCLEPPAYIKEATAVKAKGVPIKSMVAYQMLIGDPTDDVPTLKTPAVARKILQTWGTINNWFKGSKEDRTWLRANQIKLELNKKLVTLVTDLGLPDVDSLKVSKQHLVNMPAAWYAYQDFLYPKSKGLFASKR